MEYIKVTNENIDKEHICCAISNNNDIQVLSKKEWLKEQFREGLVFLKSAERGKCFIEYLPAENAWNPISADGYMYIDCLWVAGSFKGHGYGADLLDACMEDSKSKGKKGLCILSSEKKNHFCQIQNSCSIRDSRYAMKRTTGFSYGICHLQQMRLCLNLRNVPDIPMLRRMVMFCIIPASVRLMRNMFRL